LGFGGVANATVGTTKPGQKELCFTSRFKSNKKKNENKANLPFYYE